MACGSMAMIPLVARFASRALKLPVVLFETVRTQAMGNVHIDVVGKELPGFLPGLRTLRRIILLLELLAARAAWQDSVQNLLELSWQDDKQRLLNRWLAPIAERSSHAVLSTGPAPASERAGETPGDIMPIQIGGHRVIHAEADGRDRFGRIRVRLIVRSGRCRGHPKPGRAFTCFQGVSTSRIARTW